MRLFYNVNIIFFKFQFIMFTHRPVCHKTTCTNTIEITSAKAMPVCHKTTCTNTIEITSP